MRVDVATLEASRPELTGHCYRMLGSVFDADDAVQKTMIRAWRARDHFDGRSSVRTWLYRIATNVCLDELKDRSRRAHPIEEGSPSSGAPSIESLSRFPSARWIEPIPDARITPAEADPAEQAILRQSVRLAFVAALQHLAPKQRAALLLTEVVGCSAAEAADILETSVASVNSALQRARATLAKRSEEEPPELTEAQQDMLRRYVAAFESYDIESLTGLMRQDATFCMPPYSLWLQGPQENSDLDARTRVRVSRFPASFHGCVRLARVRAISPEFRRWPQGMGLDRIGTFREPNRRRQLVSGLGELVPSIRFSFDPSVVIG